MYKLEAVLFDLDGTLIDSEKNWYLSDKRWLESVGGHYTEELWEKCIGMGGRSMAVMIKNELGLKQELEDLVKQKDDFYLEQAKGNTQVFPEMLKLVKAFAVQGVTLAVASGSSLRVIQAMLAETGLSAHIKHVYSADQVAKGKPAPDVFLHAAKELKTQPRNCIVFEDSLYGVQAAKAAAMTCVAVPYKIHPERAAEFDRADLLFTGGMKDFTAEMVLEWIDSVYCQCEDCTLYEYGRCRD